MPGMVDAVQPSTWHYIRTPSVARDYDTFFAPSNLFAFDSALLAKWFARPGRLLDLGCGTGRHLVQFAERGFDVTGVDLSESMLEIARTKLARAAVAGTLHHASLLDLTRLFPRQHFDYAACMFSTLGMVAGARNRHRVLCGLRRVLRPGGRFAVHVHNRARNWFSPEGQRFLLSNAVRWGLGRSEWGDKYLRWYRGIDDLFVHVFSRRELEQALTRAGFRIRELVCLNAERDAALPSGLTVDWRANGFICLVEVPSPHDA